MRQPSRLRRLFRLPASLRSVERDVNDELEFHLESRIADLVRSGHAPDDARRIAEQEYGDVTESRAELAMVDRRIRSRERRADVIDIVRQDLAYAARGLRRQPAFAATVAITLALAVGANAAVFSLIDPLLFRAPPGVIDPGTVRRLYTNAPKAPWAVNGRAVNRLFSYPEYLAIRSSLNGVAQVAAYRLVDSSAVRRGSDTLYAGVTYATADFLPLLGARSMRGRFFTDEEDAVDTPADVCVISARFARRAFGDALDPIGQSMAVRDKPCTVIGIAGNNFEGIDMTSADIWIPFSAQPRYAGSGAGPWYTVGDVYLPLIARIKPGVDDRGLVARATPTYVRMRASKRKSDDGMSVLVGPILEDRGPSTQQQEVSISTRLAIVAGLVLLIACANIANLFLARAVWRRREIAVRLALGVSRARLASQFLAEGVVLACIAGAAALVVASWSGTVLRVALLPRVHWITAPLGVRVFAFTVVCTIGAALLAAIVPAGAGEPRATDGRAQVRRARRTSRRLSTAVCAACGSGGAFSRAGRRCRAVRAKSAQRSRRRPRLREPKPRRGVRVFHRQEVPSGAWNSATADRGARQRNFGSRRRHALGWRAVVDVVQQRAVLSAGSRLGDHD